MDGKNHTVLIADDEPEIRQVLRIFLEGERYRVLEAADGEEAVAQAGQADLILLDVMMPGCDGLTACARIRERSAAPILFLTAKGTGRISWPACRRAAMIIWQSPSHTESFWAGCTLCCVATVCTAASPLPNAAQFLPWGRCALTPSTVPWRNTAARWP